MNKPCVFTQTVIMKAFGIRYNNTFHFEITPVITLPMSRDAMDSTLVVIC